MMDTILLLNEVLSQNLLWAEWVSFSACVSLFGILVIYYSNLVPEVISRAFKYGKAADLHVDGLKKRYHLIELPKRWFFHFYLFATTFYTILAFSTIQVYVLRQDLPSFIRVLLDGYAGQQRKATVTPESVVICMILVMGQVCRRLSECTLLSVYSNARMNVVHYIFGYLFYFGVGLSVVAEAPGFTGRGINPTTIGPSEVVFKGDFFAWNYVLGVIIFIGASVLQFQSHYILANLRKDNTGKIVTLEHSIPRGGMFNILSCPHYFAEILIYLSLSLIFGGQSSTWWMVCCFVTTNQIIVGLFNHHWYHQKFKDYPRSRKAVLPYVL